MFSLSVHLSDVSQAIKSILKHKDEHKPKRLKTTPTQVNTSQRKSDMRQHGLIRV